ncbi:MAG: response regulator [Nitrospirae bacterium]|nr:response regulator [Nitrospirota bacterium]
MGKIKILVVDDESTIREIIKDMITSNLRKSLPEITVESASTGAEAIKDLKNNKYDLLLCDWQLSDMTGDKVIECLKASTELNQTPFIMITAYTDKEIIAKSLKLGAAGFIVKPFNAKTLTDKITHALKARA